MIRYASNDIRFFDSHSPVAIMALGPNNPKSYTSVHGRYLVPSKLSL